MATELLSVAASAEVRKTPSVKASSIVTAAPLPTAKPLTIDGLIRQRSRELPNEAILSYPLEQINYVDYTYRQLDVFAYRVAQRYAHLMPQRKSSQDSEVVVGLLGSSDLSYLVTILALTKLGFTVLFLSTRISDAAYVSLLKGTGAKYLLTDTSFRATADTVQKSISSLTVHEIANHCAYNFPLGGADIETRLDDALDPAIESGKTCWIIHSSGSTGLPKPILQTHEAALNNYATNLDMRGFVTLPLYHAHGISSVFRAFTSARKIHLYNASLPLTHQYLLDIMQKYNFEIFYGVPYALKLLGETSIGIQMLAKLKVVMFGGSACPDALGEKLVDAGVNLISHYGTTETGQLMTSFRRPGDKDWNYLRPSIEVDRYLQWELRSSPNIYELVVLDGWPSKVAFNRPDHSYATKDLFTPHPTTPNAWKYYARLDDTIVLLNGEKANPTATEQAIRENSNVTEAIMFGNGKPQLGMMVIPSPATKGLSSQEILHCLQPVISAANALAPGYAQLSLEMIQVLPEGTEYPRTDKGTIIRQAFYRTFEKEIDAVYNASEASSEGGLSLSELELRSFIRSELSRLLSLRDPEALRDETDFFSIGVDSLQAIQLRGILSKQLQTNGKTLGQNIVFDFPTIVSLARELYVLRIGSTDSPKAISAEDKMRALIEKYGSFPEHVPKDNTLEGQYLVVTGATGSLGAHTIAQLAIRPDVKKIYCPVRAETAASAHLRITNSMRERAVYHNIPLSARQKLVALPSNFALEDLGFGRDMYSQVSKEITCLIHCAWSVNFNLGLGSFEKDCIAGAHNLMLLCIASHRPRPAAFNFCSSVSAVASTPGGFVPEALPTSLTYAQDMGYAQSKLVTEYLVQRAGAETEMHARVLRVGQVIADTQHGIWNDKEAIPMMLQAGLTIGAIPALDESPLWLPVDIVAQTVTEISLSDAPAGVMNVVSHQPFHWTRDLLPKLRATGLQFEEVGQREWIKRLRASNPDPVANPPIRLVEFFAKKYDNDKKRKGLHYDTSFARWLSPALAAAPGLDQDIVGRFVKHFLSTAWAGNDFNNRKNDLAKRKLVVVAGPCGSGKSTIAKVIAENFGSTWVEGDELHDEAALAKMKAGVALTDADRWDWLTRLKTRALNLFFDPDAELSPTLNSARQGAQAVIVTCSALKREYRDALRNIGVHGNVETVFIMLQVGSKKELEDRLSRREEHYMKPVMVEGQIRALEEVGIDEVDVVPVDTMRGEEEVNRKIVTVLEEVLK